MRCCLPEKAIWQTVLNECNLPPPPQERPSHAVFVKWGLQQKYWVAAAKINKTTRRDDAGPLMLSLLADVPLAFGFPCACADLSAVTKPRHGWIWSSGAYLQSHA